MKTLVVLAALGVAGGVGAKTVETAALRAAFDDASGSLVRVAGTDAGTRSVHTAGPSRMPSSAF